MADWAPVVIGVVLFIFLSPGLLFQAPGKGRFMDFGNLQTSGVSIMVHAVIFFGLMSVFLVVLDVHLYVNS